MKVKITSAQIIALRSAELTDDGTYVLPTAKTQTLNALARMGVVTGPRSLTVQGVSVMHTVRDSEVIASKGHSTYLSDAPEALELFTLGAESIPSPTDAHTDAQNLVHYGEFGAECDAERAVFTMRKRDVTCDVCLPAPRLWRSRGKSLPTGPRTFRASPLPLSVSTGADVRSRVRSRTTWARQRVCATLTVPSWSVTETLVAPR